MRQAPQQPPQGAPSKAAAHLGVAKGGRTLMKCAAKRPAAATGASAWVASKSFGDGDLQGLPEGVKFEPNDSQLLAHLKAKLRQDGLDEHRLIDHFIPTIPDEGGMTSMDPNKLPGAKKDGSSRFYFHHPFRGHLESRSKRKKLQVEDADGTLVTARWHKTGQTRPVIVNRQQVGCKKIFVMYLSQNRSPSTGQKPKDLKTNWVMHQYSLGKETNDWDWVASKVFWQMTVRGRKGEVEEEGSEQTGATELDRSVSESRQGTPLCSSAVASEGVVMTTRKGSIAKQLLRTPAWQSGTSGSESAPVSAPGTECIRDVRSNRHVAGGAELWHLDKQVVGTALQAAVGDLDPSDVGSSQEQPEWEDDGVVNSGPPCDAAPDWPGHGPVAAATEFDLECKDEDLNCLDDELEEAAPQRQDGEQQLQAAMEADILEALADCKEERPLAVPVVEEGALLGRTGLLCSQEFDPNDFFRCTPDSALECPDTRLVLVSNTPPADLRLQLGSQSQEAPPVMELPGPALGDFFSIGSQELRDMLNLSQPEHFLSLDLPATQTALPGIQEQDSPDLCLAMTVGEQQASPVRRTRQQPKRQAKGQPITSFFGRM